MGPPARTRVRPFVIDGTRGPLAAIHYRAEAGLPERGAVLLVPPFAEEMNRCRSMVSLQARAFAKLGIGTLVLDPYGTGDSGGRFADATWEGWLEDLALGIAWLNANGSACRAVWGIRLGALLAVDLCRRPDCPKQLLFWQPVLSGKSYVTQFLRIRVAAELEQPDGVRSTDELRRRSQAGELLEVSGYELNPSLVAAMETAALADPARLSGRRVDWIEIIPTPEAPASRAATALAARCDAAGVSIGYHVVVGAPFWHVHERELAPNVIEETSKRAAAWTPESTEPVVGARDAESIPRTLEDSQESPLVIRSGEQELVGVLHRPTTPETRRRGAVIVVAGGPQYRAGAHRQFVALARSLSDQGIHTLRFDLQGMGDSSGDYTGFQNSKGDIAAAISAMLECQPTLHEIVLIGECESASGILFYAWTDSRVGGAVLINPWVRTLEVQAQAILKHYYLDRLRSIEFWRSVARGKWDVLGSIKSMIQVISLARKSHATRSAGTEGSTQAHFDSLPLPDKTAEGMRRFKGRALFVLSGRDLIAREFDEVTSSSPAWAGLLGDARVTRRDLIGADHTFSRDPWKKQVASWISDWLRSW
jgi:exosortase A-associated hydrolase 1/exosortase A-associated hydrolase 2